MLLLLLSFVAGLLTILAPCVLPLLPVIVGGTLVSEGSRSRRAIIIVTALAVSVVVFTLLLKASAALLNIPAATWTIVSGGIIILVGLTTIFPTIWERMGILGRLNRESNKALATGYGRNDTWGAIIIGAALGPVFSTCSPTYFLILATVLPASFALGLVYLITYAIGLALALLAVAYLGQRIAGRLGVLADPTGWFKRALGIIFVLLGIAIILGLDKQLQTRVLNTGLFDGFTQFEQQLINTQTMNDDTTNTNSTQPGRLLSLTEKAARYTKAPEIVSPSAFINTNGEPITLAELRGQGKVVLVDFWTYSCINCQRTLPHLRQLREKYRDQGFEVVGIHTPEFAFEHLTKNVAAAVDGFKLPYPVVLDNDYATWRAYKNQYWPHVYLVDVDGYIVYDHIGEGGEAATEQAIQRALAERAARQGATVTAPALTPTAETGSTGPRSPETYFGAERNDYLINGTRGGVGTATFVVPAKQPINTLALGGPWSVMREYAISAGASSFSYRYQADSVYMVAGATKGVRIRAALDGKTIAIADEAAAADGSLLIQQERLYTLVKGGDGSEHTLTITVEKEGLRAYTLTFG